jgi:hypothetical protein
LPIAIVVFIENMTFVSSSVLVFVLLSSLSVEGIYRKFISDNLPSVLILSGNVEEIVRKFIESSIKRTIIQLSISAIVLVVAY